jgi:hypothetical protein
VLKYKGVRYVEHFQNLRQASDVFEIENGGLFGKMLELHSRGLHHRKKMQGSWVDRGA